MDHPDSTTGSSGHSTGHTGASRARMLNSSLTSSSSISQSSGRSSKGSEGSNHGAPVHDDSATGEAYRSFQGQRAGAGSAGVGNASIGSIGSIGQEMPGIQGTQGAQIAQAKIAHAQAAQAVRAQFAQGTQGVHPQMVPQYSQYMPGGFAGTGMTSTGVATGPSVNGYVPRPRGYYAAPQVQPIPIQQVHATASASTTASANAAKPHLDRLSPGTVLAVGHHHATIVSFIGQGGFSHIYKVRMDPQEHGSDIGCLKRVIVPSKQGLSRLRAEVEVMRRLNQCPYAVRYYDSNAARIPGYQNCYEVLLLMELCPNKSLLDYMNDRLATKLSETEILAIMLDVGRAIYEMHRQGLVHRDIKIENVLTDAEYRFKLCDFGSTCTALPAPKGVSEFRMLQMDLMHQTTPQYRSPEMIDLYRGYAIDSRSDIWAFGVFLYKLCYYTTPFEGVGELGILHSAYNIPSKPEYHTGIKHLIGLMLQENPDYRPNIFQILEILAGLSNIDLKTLKIEDFYHKGSYKEPGDKYAIGRMHPFCASVVPLASPFQRVETHGTNPFVSDGNLDGSSLNSNSSSNLNSGKATNVAKAGAGITANSDSSRVSQASLVPHQISGKKSDEPHLIPGNASHKDHQASGLISHSSTGIPKAEAAKDNDNLADASTTKPLSSLDPKPATALSIPSITTEEPSEPSHPATSHPATSYPTTSGPPAKPRSVSTSTSSLVDDVEQRFPAISLASPGKRWSANNPFPSIAANGSSESFEADETISMISHGKPDDADDTGDLIDLSKEKPKFSSNNPFDLK